MALAYAHILVEEREVDLKNKPQELLAASPKATVPVLVLESGLVLEQSLDIMNWALQQADPEQWLAVEFAEEGRQLIQFNDQHFKPILDNYKYHQRAEICDPLYYRQQAEAYFAQLNELLSKNKYLFSSHISLADIAIFPFIRQFYQVDEQWFAQKEYSHLLAWLHSFLASPLFLQVMAKKG